MVNHIFFKKIAVFTLVAALSFSCEGGITRKSEQTQATAQQKSEQNIVYGELIVKEQSDYLMIPVGLTDKNQDRLSSYENRSSYYNNIIFYGKKDGQTNILLNKKAIITNFDLLEEKKRVNHLPGIGYIKSLIAILTVIKNSIFKTPESGIYLIYQERIFSKLHQTIAKS
ncbi:MULTISPECIES: hypothetical protein [Fischerella]|uniref:hypothetical protein n=1 Tax=Fischerella TaxID=1190 RepID=UPI0002DB4F10|nr:hypothetical protein [Fischerella muscicola]